MVDKFFRALPEFKGKRRLARFFFRHKLNTARDLRISGRMGCTYLLPNIKENVAFSIFINGIYEEKTFNFLSESIPVNGVFLDLGMNIGSISVPLCKRRKDIKVAGVEASPWVMEYLLKNIRDNHLENQVTVYNNALFHEDDIVLPFTSPREHFGRGSLAAATGGAESIDVISIKLDTLLKKNNINRVDFIKIDIEGYEYFAFKGARELLSAKDAPDIIFEFGESNERRAGLEPGSSQQILSEFGYKIYELDGNLKKRQTGILRTGFYMLFASKK